MKKAYKKNDDVIKTKVGEKFTIELEGNPSTGYQWLENSETEKVKLVDRDVKKVTDSFGGSNVEVLTFETVSEGVDKIRLDYKQAWNPDTAESVEFEIQSDPKD